MWHAGVAAVITRPPQPTPAPISPAAIRVSGLREGPRVGGTRTAFITAQPTARIATGGVVIRGVWSGVGTEITLLSRRARQTLNRRNLDIRHG